MMRFLPVNDRMLLVELHDLEQTLALLASLQNEPIAGLDELVPAARTILLGWRPGACSRADLQRQLSRRDVSARSVRGGTLVEIPVHYDGEDLAEVAQLLGTTPQEVVRRHTGSSYTVAFTGFAPGFSYLSGGHASLNVPRRSSPRTRIPAGAVGLAGRFSGIYPQASPGGWQIIGHTPAVMWDLARAPPALLQPGYQVRFVDAGALAAGTAEAERTPQAAHPSALPLPMRFADDATLAPASDVADAAGLQAAHRAVRPPGARQPAACGLEILSPGAQTLFQDLGRSGQAGQGVSASGAMDGAALKAANRLVGNASDSACLECAGGGLHLRSHSDTVLAVTGADGPLTLTSADGRHWPLPRYQALALADGDTLALGPPRAGLYSYLAVRGGFAVAPVLGSCATDTLARIGPAPLAAGDRLALQPPQYSVVGPPGEAPGDRPGPQDVVTLEVVLGPRSDWFTPAALECLLSQPWQVTPQSNRIGLRLAGALALARAVPDELPSEGTARGAIQVPPSGQPVLFLADHPLTGGYPVIAGLVSHDLDRAGQVPVHAWLRFCPALVS